MKTLRTVSQFVTGGPARYAALVASSVEYTWVRGLRLATHAFQGTVEQGTVLAIHGFMDHGCSFQKTAEHLGDGRLVGMDMRGHGSSDWVGTGGYYHFYDYYADVAAFLAKRPERTYGLLGHSMGGSVASAVAALFPEQVRWLLLLEGMGPPAHPLDDSVARLRRWIGSLSRPGLGPTDQRRRSRSVMRDRDEAASRLLRVNPRLSPSHARSLAETFVDDVEGGVVWAYDPLHRTPAAKPFVMEEARAMWREIRCPVLSMWGGQSGFRPPDLDDRHACLSRVCAVEIPEAGHNLHHEHPDVVAKAIELLDRGRLECPPSCVALEGGPSKP
ncbi:MAG: alpha/beta fold hydrolase [Myxococcota bacterium]